MKIIRLIYFAIIAMLLTIVISNYAFADICMSEKEATKNIMLLEQKSQAILEYQNLVNTLEDKEIIFTEMTTELNNRIKNCEERIELQVEKYKLELKEAKSLGRTVKHMSWGSILTVIIMGLFLF